MNRFRIPQAIQATSVLMLMNMVVFIILTIRGGSQQVAVLANSGAMVPVLITYEHQYWRLLTAAFLHSGLMHLIFNMYSLFILGSILEPIFERERFLLIYILSSLMGNAMSYAFSSPLTVSVGASSAIFGLMGTVVLLGWLFPRHYGIRVQSQQFLSVLGINLLFSFLIPGMDLYAHLGGLVGGFLIGYIVGIGRYKRAHQLVGLAIYSIVFIILILLGRK